MLSVIFVPILSLLLLAALYFLLSPRRRQDAPAATQFQLQKAIAFIDEKAEKFSERDYKKLDMIVSRAKGDVDRARMEDVYDMTFPYGLIADARAFTQALTLVSPEGISANRHLERVKKYLTAAATYIETYCGVSGKSGEKTSLAVFNKKARVEKARKFLEEQGDESKN